MRCIIEASNNTANAAYCTPSRRMFQSGQRLDKNKFTILYINFTSLPIKHREGTPMKVDKIVKLGSKIQKRKLR